MNSILRYPLIALLAILCRNVSADTYTYTFESKTFSANGTVSLGGVDWTLDTDAGYFGYDTSSGRGQQIGSKNNPCTYATLSTTGIPGTITSVVVNTSGASGITATLDVTVGGETFGEQQTLTTTATSYSFEGSGSGEIALNYSNSSSAAVYILSIEVTYTTDESYVASPTISGETSFTGSTTVTITAGEGATIYWTTDGTDPTTETENSGTSPVTFTITESCTVKAIAVVDGVSSSVSSKTFTAIELEQHTIASLNALTSNVSNIELTLTNAKVVYVTTSYNGNVIHLREGGMAIMLYDTSLEMPLNAVVSGTMRGDFVYYYGIPEVKDNSYTNAEGLTINESDEAAEPTDVSIGDLLELNNRCDLVRISEVTITSEASGSYTNYYANYGDERIQLYGGIDMASYADDGKTYDVVAVFNNIYNGVAEIAPISVTEYVNTGISSVENADGENVEKVIYNLSGQRLSQPVKGINIISGKKVIVR